jgi:transposase-like protein
MRTYSADFKASVIEKLLPPQHVDVVQLAQESGIPKDTLYSWRSQARRERGLTASPAAAAGQRWRSEEKFTVVVETAALNEAALGEYCRKRGLYREQITTWRAACQQANPVAPSPKARPLREAQADKRRIRDLERELRRKDKALAEAAALLVLQKKAQAIWGDSEDV